MVDQQTETPIRPERFSVECGPTRFTFLLRFDDSPPIALGIHDALRLIAVVAGYVHSRLPSMYYLQQIPPVASESDTARAEDAMRVLTQIAQSQV